VVVISPSTTEEADVRRGSGLPVVVSAMGCQASAEAIASPTLRSVHAADLTPARVVPLG